MSGQLVELDFGTIRYFPKMQDGSDITHKLALLVDECVDGDIVVLPQGKYKLSNTILIREKSVSFIGQGADTINGTVLYKDIGSVVEEFDSFLEFGKGPSLSNKVIISGIYFRSLPSNRYSGGQMISLIDNGLEFYHNTNFIITDNIFQYFGAAGVVVYHLDSIVGFNGLIFNNQFLDLYRTEIGDLGYGVLVAAHYSENSKWIQDPGFGSRNFLFVENNHFRNTRHAISGGGNAKYVFRFNDILNNWAAPAIDMHGGGNYGNLFSSRAAEIYNNAITSLYDGYGLPIDDNTHWSNYTPAMGIRGGEALIFENTSYNCRNLVRFHIEELNPDTYPTSYQIGYQSGIKYGPNDNSYFGDHGDGDVFTWNNHFNIKFPFWEEYSTVDTSFLKYGRDIQLEIKKPEYVPYLYPHDYRNYFYSLIDTFINDIVITQSFALDSNTIQLKWKDVLGEDGYYLYHSIDGESFTIIDVADMNQTNLVVPNLEPRIHWFYVCAFNDEYIGEKSQILRINPKNYYFSHHTPVIIYPNPSVGLFYIMVIDEGMEVESIVLSDFSGRILYNEVIYASNEGVVEVELHNFQKGSYILIVELEGKQYGNLITIY